MELSYEMLKEVSYIKISTYRIKVMKSLDNDVKIQSKIAKDSDIRQNNISNVLKQLKKHGLVEYANPEAKNGKLYRLTDDGKKMTGNLTND